MRIAQKIPSHCLRNRWVLLLCVAMWGVGASSLGAPPSAGDFKAANSLGASVANWVLTLSLEKGQSVVPPLGEKVEDNWKDPRIKQIDSVSIVALEEHNPVDPALSNVIEAEMMEAIRRVGISKITTCYECRTPAVYIQDNEIVVSKGIADVDAIKRVAKKINTDILLVTEVFRTKYTIITQVAAYNVSTGELLGSEKFSADSLAVEDDTVQLLFTFGTGAPLLTNSTTTNTEGQLTASANIQLTEELGFAKGGLNLGLVMAEGNSLIHLAPTLGFRGNIGNSTMKWMFNVGAGYGIQSDLRGIIGRSSFELILGSWAALGADSVFFFPDGDSTAPFINGYIGFHIGISIGR